MRFSVALVLSVFALNGQTCAPSRILPNDSVSGRLDDPNCQLSDGSAYTSYRLDLPVRGQIQIDLPGLNADFILILRDTAGVKIDSGTSIKRPMEAGSYIVLVDGRTAGQVGTYSLQTVFASEPGMICTGFAALGLNQTVNGTLGASGCAMLNGTPYEAYTVRTFGAGTLTVTASGAEMVPAVIVRGSDGGAVASGGGTVNAAVAGDSEYQIVLLATEGGGSYQIVTSFEPSDTDTCQMTKALTDSASETGTVRADSCVATIAESGDSAFYNYYGLTVNTAGLADLTAASDDFGPTLNLLDASGVAIASNSGGGGKQTAEIRMQLLPGNYVVQVFSGIPTVGAYRLSYTFTEGRPQTCWPVTMNPGDSQQGSLTATSCLTNSGLGDIYGVTLPSAGTLDVEMKANLFSGVVALRDTKDNLIVFDQDVQGLGSARLTADLPAGSYTVAAAANAGSGLYQLSSAFKPHEIPPCGYVQKLELNGGYVQKLNPGSCRDTNGQPMDLYEFTLPSESVVAAILTSSELDGFLSLLDESGNVLRSDDNSYGFEGSLIVQYLPAGKYRLAARAASATVGGYYEVDLRTVPGARPGFCKPRSTVELGVSVAGTINFTGCQYPDASFADIYAVRLANDTAIDVRLVSKDFDAFLILLDAKGNVLAQDDDGAGGTDARITNLLGAGTYYVVAKPFSDYVSAGGYSLTVGQGQ